jgi:putative transposase
MISVDNGPEFTSTALDVWAWASSVKLDFSRLGKPGDNASIEAFNARVRQEFLSQHYLSSLDDARRTVVTWREDYNNHRPHSALGGRTPAEFRASLERSKAPDEPEKLRA